MSNPIEHPAESAVTTEPVNGHMAVLDRHLVQIEDELKALGADCISIVISARLTAAFDEAGNDVVNGWRVIGEGRLGTLIFDHVNRLRRAALRTVPGLE